MSKYFKTSDGEEFYTENHAHNHARSLKDKTVTPPSVAAEEQEEPAEATPVVQLADMTKKKLIAFADSKEIKVDEKATNAAIIAVIEEALAKEIEVVNLEVVNPIADEIGTKQVVTENTQE